MLLRYFPLELLPPLRASDKRPPDYPRTHDSAYPRKTSERHATVQKLPVYTVQHSHQPSGSTFHSRPAITSTLSLDIHMEERRHSPQASALVCNPRGKRRRGTWLGEPVRWFS